MKILHSISLAAVLLAGLTACQTTSKVAAYDAASTTALLTSKKFWVADLDYGRDQFSTGISFTDADGVLTLSRFGNTDIAKSEVVVAADGATVTANFWQPVNCGERRHEWVLTRNENEFRLLGKRKHNSKCEPYDGTTKGLLH